VQIVYDLRQEAFRNEMSLPAGRIGWRAVGGMNWKEI